MRTRRTDGSRLSLNGAWRYAPDAPQFDLGHHLRWMQSAFDDCAWPEMQVPVCWDLADPALHGYEGYVWFRRTFTAGPLTDTTPVLWFDGVNYRADVWVNGAYLGAHEGGYAPFSFDIRAALVPDGPNCLVVRVDNRPLPERIPGTRLSWSNYGGLYRDVYIEQRPLLHIAEVVIAATPDASGRAGPATVEVTVTVRNDGGSPCSVNVTAGMEDAAVTAPLEIAPQAEASVALTAHLDEVAYWSPEQPVLHELVVDLLAGDEIVDRQPYRVGVRRLTTDGVQLRLNGERITIRGYNRHEEYPTTGRAHDEAMLRADLEAIRRTGANFVRASHYPMHHRFYDLCDELGLMVMDEIPLWGWGRDRGETDLAAPIAQASQQLDELVIHQRNRTCVVIWSVSNESAGAQDLIDRTNIDLMRRARELDPTRLVTHVALYAVWQTGHDAAMAEDDILSLNEYEGSLNLDPPVRTEADLVLAQANLGGHLDALHAIWPHKPMLITEFGGIGLPSHHYASPWSEDGYAATIRAHWATFAARAWIVGGLLWCWQDYPMHPNRVRTYPLGLYGVVSIDRVPKQPVLDVMHEIFAMPAKENTDR